MYELKKAVDIDNYMHISSCYMKIITSFQSKVPRTKYTCNGKLLNSELQIL